MLHILNPLENNPRLASDHNPNLHYVLSLKAKPIISHKVSRVQKLEEPLDPTVSNACIAKL